MTVEIGELETVMVFAQGTESSVALGMTVKNLTPEVVRQLGYEQKEGVFVTAVEPLGWPRKPASP